MNESNKDDEVNLLELTFVLVKNMKKIAVVSLCAAVVTSIITLLMPNVYTAKTLIVPSDDDSNSVMGAMMAQMGGLAALAGGGLGGATKGELYITMMNSESIEDPIIDRFKLMQHYDSRYRAEARAELKNNSDVSAGKKDGVITVTVNDEDPKLAADIANAYIEELGRLATNLNMSGAGANRGFLEKRLAKAKADLAAAEDTLKSFQQRNKAVAVTDQAKASLEGAAELRAQLMAQEVQLAAMRQQLTDESQQVKAVKASIGSLRAQITRIEGDSAEGSLPGVGSVPQLGQEYIRLMREYKIQETLVELLTKQYEMAKLNESKDVAPFQVLQTAYVPELKSKPKRALIVITVTLAAAFLTLVSAFVRDSCSKMDASSRGKLQEIKDLFLATFKR